MTRADRILDLCENSRVLDIGCYGDRTAYPHPLWLHGHILDTADDVIGIDINEKGIDNLQQDGYDVYHRDAENFDLNEKFDLIVGAEVIEHLTSPSDFLDCAEDHLDDGGKLVVTTPNLHSLFILGAYFSPRYDEEEHTLGFTPKILENLFVQCGWTIETIELVTHEDIPRFGTRVANAIVPKRFNFTIFCKAHPK